MNTSPIETSLLELFKVGPGPSSSHTMGPMRAGENFIALCRAQEVALVHHAKSVRVRLYGSLSATGDGHGTSTAVLAGLLGATPESCPPGRLRELGDHPHEPCTLAEPLQHLCLSVDAVEHAALSHDFPYSNTLIIELLNAQQQTLLSREYYSTGGGFIQWKGWQAPARGRPVYPFASMRNLKVMLRETGLNLHEVVLTNESAITGMSRPSILTHLDELMEHMEAGVERGLCAQGILPGGLNVQRKAELLRSAAARMPLRGDRFLCSLNAYAFATAEENASGGVIVTAPTCGAAGVMPALMYAMRHDLSVGDRGIREGLLAAAVVGYLAKHNAGIAGAEVGCQGEVGVASAMAAAMLAHARGCSVPVVENAAEIALEHHLGLTCDPVGGHVQIPCIERNAVGAIKAYNAVLLASSIEPAYQRVSLDAVITAMAETGRDMHQKFKETSLGGLAVSMVNC